MVICKACFALSDDTLNLLEKQKQLVLFKKAVYFWDNLIEESFDDFWLLDKRDNQGTVHSFSNRELFHQYERISILISSNAKTSNELFDLQTSDQFSWAQQIISRSKSNVIFLKSNVIFSVSGPNNTLGQT